MTTARGNSPSANELVLDLLSLHDEVPGFNLRNLCEILAVVEGTKQVTRLVLASEDVTVVTQLLKGAGLAVASSTWSIKTVYTTTLGDEYLDVVPDSDSRGGRRIVAIACSFSDAIAFLDAERAGDNSAMARLLGYPACCVASYERIGPSRDWLQVMLEQSPEQSLYSYGANRIDYLFSDASLFYDYFPCSLTCEETRQISRATLGRLHKHGLDALANRLAVRMAMPVVVLDDGVLQLHGARVESDIVRVTAFRTTVFARTAQLKVPQTDSVSEEGHELVFRFAGKTVLRLPRKPASNRLILFSAETC